MVQVPGNGILDIFFPKNDRTKNNLYLLANKYINHAQIQTGFTVKVGKVRGNLEYEVEMGLKDFIT